MFNPICKHTIIENNGVCKVCQELKKVKTTDDARNYFKFHDLEYSDIGSKELFLLHKILTKNLEKFNINDEYSYHWIKSLPISNKKLSLLFETDGSIRQAYIRCEGDWFDEREAISFNSNGFIGFCGWAGSSNQYPFIESFVEWILILKNKNKA